MTPAVATAAPAMKPPQAAPVPIWNCSFSPINSPAGAPLDSLTVGTPFNLQCHGDLAVAWTKASVQVQMPTNESPYSLAILKTVRQDPNDVQYIVTSYMPGAHHPAYVRVLQGNNGFEFDQPAWQVKSVLNPKSMPHPYGPYGPFGLALPLWFVAATAAILLLVAALAFKKIRRYIQRRKMIEELKRHTTALSPLHQFYRDARQLRRRLNQAKSSDELKTITLDMNREFRLYVLRRFQVPALEWSDRAILEDLRRRHRRTYKHASEHLRKILRELSKLSLRPEVADQDVEQIYRMSMDAVEELDQDRGGGK